MGRTLRLIIIGAGGHARVIADAVSRPVFKHNQFELLGFLDDNPKLLNTDFCGRPVLGNVSELKKFAHDSTIIGIGDNKIRSRLFDQLSASGANLATIVHPSAIIGAHVNIGKGTVVFARVVINAMAIIEENVILNTACTVGYDCQISSHAHIGSGAHLGGEVHVEMGARVDLGSNVVERINIGQWAIVETKATVIRDVPAFNVVSGVPAV